MEDSVLKIICILLPLVVYMLFHLYPPPMNEIQVVGNIHAVLSGNVREEIISNIHPNDFEIGLGCGTFGDLEDVGEAIIFDNKIFIRVSNEEKNYGVESSVNNSNSFLRTPFSIGISRHSEIFKEVEVINKSLTDFFGEMLPLLENSCFGIYGRANFSYLSSLAIKKSPMEGVDITENREKYFHEENNVEDVEAVFVGIVIKESEFLDQYSEVSKFFFHNVYLSNSVEDEKYILDHVHVAIVKERDKGENYFDTSSLEIYNVEHLHSKSTMKNGKIRVFEIQGLSRFK